MKKTKTKGRHTHLLAFICMLPASLLYCYMPTQFPETYLKILFKIASMLRLQIASHGLLYLS